MTLNTDAHILSKIQALQIKIQRLEALQTLAPFEQCNFFFYGSGGKFLAVNENDVPFDLAIEIKILIDAAIDYYQDEIKSLSNSFL
jgi:hypothetical protein